MQVLCVLSLLATIMIADEAELPLYRAKPSQVASKLKNYLRVRGSVEPRWIYHRFKLSSAGRKLGYEGTIELQDDMEFSFSDNQLGVKVSLRSRVHDDDTVTTRVAFDIKGAQFEMVERQLHGNDLVFKAVDAKPLNAEAEARLKDKASQLWPELSVTATVLLWNSNRFAKAGDQALVDRTVAAVRRAAGYFYWGDLKRSIDYAAIERELMAVSTVPTSVLRSAADELDRAHVVPYKESLKIMGTRPPGEYYASWLLLDLVFDRRVKLPDLPPGHDDVNLPYILPSKAGFPVDWPWSFQGGRWQLDRFRIGPSSGPELDVVRLLFERYVRCKRRVPESTTDKQVTHPEVFGRFQ
jgi:hypothetical protein